MKATRYAAQIAAVALSLSPLASAWPSWPRWLPEVDSLVVVRAEESSSPPATDKPAPTSTATTNTDKPSRTVTTTNLNTGGRTTPPSTGKGKSGTSTSKTGHPKHTMYNEQDPAGSVVMVTPAATMGLQLYRIDEYVTFGWNYTNLQGTPTAVDVLASCSVASNTWTLTQNMTFETAGSFTWDTGAYQATAVQSPLLTEMYTLIIYDADSSVSATAEAGYLAPFTGFTFGLYEGKQYHNLSDWECVTCSAGVSTMDRRALGAAVAMSVLTVLSFTWFVTGLGVLV